MFKNLFSNNFFSIWSPWFFGRSLKKKITHEFILNETPFYSRNLQPRPTGKDVPRKSILNKSGIFLKISLPSFSSTVPTIENVYTKHYFISTCLQNKNILFSVWVFINFNSKFLLCENLASFQTFTETAN